MQIMRAKLENSILTLKNAHLDFKRSITQGLSSLQEGDSRSEPRVTLCGVGLQYSWPSSRSWLPGLLKAHEWSF